MSSCYSGYDDRSFEFDDDSSFDSGYEKSFETDCNGAPVARKLCFNGAADFYGAAENPLGLLNASLEQAQFSGLLDNCSNQSGRSSRTLVDHVIRKVPLATDGDTEFAPKLGAQTSTPAKKAHPGVNGSQPTEPKPKRKYAVGKNRVTRSRSPTQVTRIKKFRRMKANDRERNRMHSLNDALEKLRVTLPSLPEETKLTKIEILRFAHNYIFALEQVLESGGSINLDLEKLQNFTLSGERITKELFDAIFVNPQPYPMMGMGSYGMPGRVPFPHSESQTPHHHNQYDHLPPQHQHQQQQLQHPSEPPATGFSGSYEMYDNMRHYGTEQMPRHNLEDPTMSPHFSQEKFELFKGTFEAAANIRGATNSTAGYHTHYPAHHTQMPTEVSCYTPNGADATIIPPMERTHLHGANSATPARASNPATSLHHSSSFYSQTPPWKDYSEQLVNTHHSFQQYSAV